MDQMFQLGDSQGSQSQGKDKGKTKEDSELSEANRLEGKLTRRSVDVALMRRATLIGDDLDLTL